MVDNKDPNGVFFAPKQKLYYFKSNQVSTEFGNPVYLNKDATYVLELNINNGQMTVMGETELISEISSGLYTSSQPFRFVDNQIKPERTTFN